MHVMVVHMHIHYLHSYKPICKEEKSIMLHMTKELYCNATEISYIWVKFLLKLLKMIKFIHQNQDYALAIHKLVDKLSALP